MKNLLLILFLTVFAGYGWAQTRSISGTVTSAEDGEPLIGATVMVKGKPALGVATDIDGQYVLSNIPDKATLVFSYVGFQTLEKAIGSNVTLDVVLQPASDLLDEVVVVGYGTVKKSDLTGAVASVSGESLDKTPAASLSNALQGKVAGVTVNSLTGRPGAGAEVRIRGVGTVNGASPIYVVDGVICDDINFLSTSDIEHIEVLKDASATAIYGSRGANGVIIVSTKGGKKNQSARITFDGYIGFQQRWKKLEVMNAKDFADTYVAINANARSKKSYEEDGFNAWLGTYKGVKNSDYYPTIYNADTNPDGFDYSKVDTDWQDVVFRNGLIQNYHLAVDGGTEKVTYSMSGS